MDSEEELAAAIAATQSVGLPYVATMTFDTDGHTMMGLTPQQAVINIKQHGVLPIAFGANCGMGPAQLIDSILAIKQGASAQGHHCCQGQCRSSKDGYGLARALPRDTASHGRLRLSGTRRWCPHHRRLLRNHARSTCAAWLKHSTRNHVKTLVDHAEIERKLGPMRLLADGQTQRRKRR